MQVQQAARGTFLHSTPQKIEQRLLLPIISGVRWAALEMSLGTLGCRGSQAQIPPYFQRQVFLQVRNVPLRRAWSTERQLQLHHGHHSFFTNLESSYWVSHSQPPSHDWKFGLVISAEGDLPCPHNRTFYARPTPLSTTAPRQIGTVILPICTF